MDVFALCVLRHGSGCILIKKQIHQLKIRGLFSRILKYYECSTFSYCTFQIGNNNGPDQNAWKCRLVCAFAVYMQQNLGFS